MVVVEKASNKLFEILSKFAIQGTVGDVEPFGSGHIHDTYHVKNLKEGEPDYLLQCINHNVFKNIPALMENIQVVTSHLRKKLEHLSGADPEQEVLTLVSTKEREWYYKDNDGSFWRVYHFIPDTFTYDVVKTAELAYEGGKAFGRFQALLADLPVHLLHDTIPDFHNVVNRLRLYHEVLQKDPVNRVAEVKTEIAFVEERAEAMSAIYKLGKAGKLPLRITHNDTKFNNVLLDKNDKAQCVVDLDTVMPGFVAYDFGDAIRTTINTAPEDEPDLEEIQISVDLFRGFTEGFLEETGHSLTRTEIESLSHGVLLLPFIMGLRFLTDYIDGDNYYKIHHKGHNLQRARAQFQLVRKLEEQYDLLRDIIGEVAKNCKEVATVTSK
ncbi:phosphotransferase enzyme family protein [Rufibacter roseus]|uniref:Phosphotransferase enzyme family protein n=1 Tax=Rufibacter roseus TaxID=1567108 RepID=A0ABW2DSD3_9BACT|nr:aminoglycoside phosphotransferase family protein [Rufibacter roseus]